MFVSTVTDQSRKFVFGCVETYRYGMNGQEKDNEIATGLYSAEYWEYDSRIGRRWNRDPIFFADQSPYATFFNNPIYFADPLGLEGEPKTGSTKTNKDGSVSTYNGTKWIDTPVGQAQSPEHAIQLDEISIGSDGSASVTKTKNAAEANIDNSTRAGENPYDIAHPDPNYKPTPEQKAWYSLADNFPKIAAVSVVIPFVAEPLAVGAVEELAGVPIWTTLGGGILKSTIKQSEKKIIKESTQDLVGNRATHILNRHKFGASKPGKTEFPSTWTDSDIINNVNKIANDVHASGGIGPYEAPFKTGTIDGIDIRVDFYPNTLPNGLPHPNAGKVSTAYPTNVTPNPK